MIRRFAFATTIALIAAVLTATPATASPVKPAPWNVKPVAGASAGQVASPGAPASSKSAAAPAVGSWAVGSFSGALPTGAGIDTAVGHVAGAWQRIGASGVQVAAASPTSSGAVRRQAVPVASSVKASVLSAAAAKKYGLKGLVVQLQRGDGGSGAAPVAVKVPNSVLGARYGGDYASRLRWTVVIPAGEPVPQSVAGPSAQDEKLKHAVTSDIDSTQDAGSDSTVLMPQVTSSKLLLTAASTPTASDGTGNFAATPLSASSKWDVSAQTGDFSWSYDMRTPPAAAGPSPDLGLQYDSQSVDGETGSTNNQPSAVGEGWTASGGGFIERSYVPCSLDDGSSGPVATSGDQCWKTDNATVSFAGHSGQLVKDSATGVWQLQSDDNSRVEHLVGTSAGCAANGTYDTDCWRITTTDGTQYYFGLNQLPGWSAGQPTTNSAWTVPVYGNDTDEPCHAASFAASSCMQAWRWNLDYVVDAHGNAEAFYYDAESNSYAQNGGAAVSYIRGGQLDHIDYGFTTGNAYATNAASDRVTYTYAANGRCSDASGANCSSEPITSAATAPAHANYYPDVPFDQLCSGSCPTSVSPTFFTDGMLQNVTTYVLKSGSYSKVDSWKLDHSFPDPQDTTSAALWLTQVTHTGYAGTSSISEPPTVFTGVAMQNRVWVIDGLSALWKYRISSIQDSLGSVTSINYSPQECTPAMAPSIEANPQSNTYRCFPEQWTPQYTPPQPSRTDLFHKYVVTSTVADPHTGGGTDQATETDYVYGTPAWRYDTSPLIPAANRTWSQFAGYNTVEVRVGDHTAPSAQNVTDYTFYQGMDGDRASSSGGTKSVNVTGTSIPDSLWFAGQVYEQKTLLGVGGSVVTDTVNTPWASTVKASDGTYTARFTGTGATTTTVPLSTGGSRTTSTVTSFDDGTGLPTTVENDATGVASTCTTTSYAPANTTVWIVGLPSEVQAFAKTCATIGTATYPADAISDTKTSYDGAAWNTAPTRGDATQVQVVDKYTGSTASTAHWITKAQSQYDAMGRPLQVTDALGHTTSTAYTPAAGASVGSGALTSETVTNTAPFSWTTTTAFDPAWGVETSYTDQNASVTTASYDALGRRTGVWDPDNPQATAGQPSVAYAYTLSQTAPNAIETRSLQNTAIVDTFVLYDGLARQIQTQTFAEGGGSDITDTWYDTQGRVWTTNGDYWASGTNPSVNLFTPGAESQIAQENVTTFDPVGRATKQTLISFGVERRHTTTSYLGADRVDAVPPAGGTPTSTFTDANGKQTQLVQYLSAGISGTQEATSYTYDPSGRMTGMTDPAGNHWSWTFDVLGNQVGATDPDTGTTTKTYDAAGNVLTSTDGRGVTLAYSYDALNRKTAEYQDSTGSSGTELASWAYDTATLGKGLLANSTRYVGSAPGAPGSAYVQAVNSYDPAGNATKTTLTIPASAPAFAGSYATTSTFDVSGALTTMTYPAEGGLASERLRMSYDANGRPDGLAGTSIYDSVQYSAIGQVTQHTRLGANSLYTDYGYDNGTGQLLELKHFIDTGSATIYPQTSDYTNDPAGNVTKIATTSDSAATDTQCFGYDQVQELTRAWTPSSGDCSTAPTAAGLGGPAPYWTDYAVDPATGNRIGTTSTTSAAVTTASYAYPNATSLHPHAVSSVTTTVGTGTPVTKNYGYNAEGDTTTRPGESLTYDAEGHLASVTDGGSTQSNIYDADGTLLLQADAGNYTLYAGGTELHKDGTAAVYAVRTYSLAGAPIAERTTTAGVTGSVLRWLGADNHGTVSLEVVVSTGATTVRFEDPYGNPRGTNPSWSSGHTFLNDDQATTSATVTIGARTYDPVIGKFLTVDTVLAPMNPLQNNGYSYSANNPVGASDPSGNCFMDDASNRCVGYTAVGGKASAPSSGAGAPTTPGHGKSHKPPSLRDKVWWWLAGFNEDQDGILRTRANPAQLRGGYNDPYDFVFKAAGTGAQAQKYPFEYDHKSYVVWMWKGEYMQMGDGAEIGFYSQNVPLAKAGPQWNADPDDPNLPTMSESLTFKDSGAEIASFAPAKPQVWVGSWNQNVGSWDPANADANTKNLSVTATVNFPDSGMYKAFRNTWAGDRAWKFSTNSDNTATVRY